MRGRLATCWRTRCSPGTSCSPLVGLVVVVLVLESVDDFRSVQLAAMAYLGIAAGGLTVLTGLNGQISLGPRRPDGDRRLHDRAAAARPRRRRCRCRRASCARDRGRPWSSARSSGVAAARLHGPYLAGATLALAVAVPGIALYFERDASAASRGSACVLPDIPDVGARRGVLRHRQDLTREPVRRLPRLVHADRHVRAAGQPRRAAGSAAAGGPCATTRSPAELAGIDLGRARVSAFVVSAAAAGAAGRDDGASPSGSPRRAASR